MLQLYKMCARLKRATVSLLFISHSRSGESPGPACQLYILLLYDNNTIPKFWHQSWNALTRCHFHLIYFVWFCFIFLSKIIKKFEIFLVLSISRCRSYFLVFFFQLVVVLHRLEIYICGRGWRELDIASWFTRGRFICYNDEYVSECASKVQR